MRRLAATGGAAGALSLVGSMLLTACGGGGGSAGAPAVGPGSGVTPVVYANSLVLGGGLGVQSLSYNAAQGVMPASVTATTASALLAAGSTPLVAEHADAAYPGMREVCVSGHGETTNAVGPINLGVMAQSAALLLDSGWSPGADRAAAWSALAARGATLSGWENCGVKPEGAASRSSGLTAQVDGSYREDVYDGNPGTTFNTVTQAIPATQMSAMLSDAGYDASAANPQRPLRLYWRLYVDGSARQLWVQIGVPATGATASVVDFVSVYTSP